MSYLSVTVTRKRLSCSSAEITPEMPWRPAFARRDAMPTLFRWASGPMASDLQGATAEIRAVIARARVRRNAVTRWAMALPLLFGFVCLPSLFRLGPDDAPQCTVDMYACRTIAHLCIAHACRHVHIQGDPGY